MYVSNLPEEISKVELEAMFCRLGRIVDSFIPVDWTTRRKRGFGFVRFKFEKEASNALNIVTGRSWGGRLIRTHFARLKENQQIPCASVLDKGHLNPLTRGFNHLSSRPFIAKDG